MKKRKKTLFNVTCSTPLCLHFDLDDNLDDKLETLAKQCRGELGGTGSDFRMRDYSFYFKRYASARKFVAQLGLRARMWRIKDRVIWVYENDEFIEAEEF